MSKSKKRNIIIGSLCAIVLLMTVGYAAFQTVLNIEGTSNITSSWDIKITNVTSKNIKGTASNNGDPSFENLSATFKTNLQAPGDSIEYDITVTNNGSLNAKLDKYKLTDTNNEAIKFTQTGLTNGEVLTAGSTKTFTVKVEYLSTTSEQPSKVTSSLTITLDYSQAENGYTPGEQVASEQLISNLVTSGDGLYEDTYEPGRYVYKGANPNNYITLNNEEWRIIAVEADGTLKIRKNESIGDMAFDQRDEPNRNNNSNTYCQQALIMVGTYYGCNAWSAIEGMRVNGNKVGTVTEDASLNTYLNVNYYNMLTSTAQKAIQSHNFETGAVITNNNNLSNQIVSENEITWTGNIGLIKVSDYLRANSNTEQCNSFNANNENYNVCKNTNYLVPTFGYEWTISPYYDFADDIFFIDSVGRVNNDYIRFGGRLSVLPTLHLKSDITLTGEGTKTNPYLINLTI